MWAHGNPLAASNLGLMLASGGIDGVYLQKLNGWVMGGYILNIVADFASHELMVSFGKLWKRKANWTKVAKWFVLGVAVLSVFYTWLFSWRQLRFMVYVVETNPMAKALKLGSYWETVEKEVIAFLSAGFAPVMIAGLGLVEGIMFIPEPAASKEIAKGSKKIATANNESEKLPPTPKEKFKCRTCDREFKSPQARGAHEKVHKGKENG